MTKRDAIQAMLDGKKVRQTPWPDGVYIFYNGNSFTDDKHRHMNMNTYPSGPHWEIYEEPKKKIKIAPMLYREKINMVWRYDITTEMYRSMEDAMKALYEYEEFVRWPAHEGLVFEVEEI